MDKHLDFSNTIDGGVLGE